MSRKSQGNFRKKMLKHTSECEVTGFSKLFALDACHLKPFSVCSEEEQDDPHNVICLMSNIHRAFDAGYISFGEDGSILISKSLTPDDLMRLGLSGNEKIRLGGRRPDYLLFHRENIFNKVK